MRALRTIVVVLLVALGFLGGYFVGWYLHGENVVRLSAGQANAAKKAGDLQQRIIEELQGRYYKAVDVDKLSQAGVRGSLKSLNDPYTVYLSPTETQAFEEKQSGQYSGIGAALEKSKQGLVITSVFAGSPAAKAGLKPGDIIVTVDGQPTADAAIESSIARIKGKEGTCEGGHQAQSRRAGQDGGHRASPHRVPRDPQDDGARRRQEGGLRATLRVRRPCLS